MGFNDDVLKKMYVEYDIPCDELVSSSVRLKGFADDYIGRTGHQVQPEAIGRHMLKLRKIGQARGGLPRIRR